MFKFIFPHKVTAGSLSSNRLFQHILYIQKLNANSEKGCKGAKGVFFNIYSLKRKYSELSLTKASYLHKWETSRRGTFCPSGNIHEKESISVSSQCCILESEYSTTLHLRERDNTTLLCTKHWTLAKNGKTIFSICILPTPRVWTAYFRVAFQSHIWKGKNTVAQQPETFYFESFSFFSSLVHLTFPETAFFFIEKEMYYSKLELATLKSNIKPIWKYLQWTYCKMSVESLWRYCHEQTIKTEKQFI